MNNYNKPFLIGETAFHHQGELNYLIKLIDEGVNAGVDALKFHLLFDLDDYFIKDHEAYEVLENMIIPENDWNEIHSYCLKKGIKPIYLCNDVKAIRWVKKQDENSVLGIEIHATGINDIFLLEEASKFTSSVFLGTGGSTFDEIEFAISYLKNKGIENLILMHGFQSYPTNYKDAILSKLSVLRDLYKLPVGYADHTDPNDKYNSFISTMGVASGFNILEKHFTLDTSKKRIDSQAAVSVDQLKEIRNLMNVAFEAFSYHKRLDMSDSEKAYGNVGPMKKALVAAKDIGKGQKIEITDLAYKRTNNSVPVKQNEIFSILGAVTKQNIDKDTPINYNLIEYKYKKPDVSQFFVTEK
ncbi:N-acetylneuraminate synthase family protein [Mangrovivirga sp. M17]|uniref:N-acetylneuraminate synthase family protein n=1 Tax=Mangrovivirga halotolerans TaxID=2993936 RepID=A0ABT3RTS8_9BACT|nr:N-acetylneuraminate synthase family protein [Mangrovivirga halotolerans]MCX2745190.1 N-acetylneuraminate synthase family protein [Mangrovivirga halotolerans]